MLGCKYTYAFRKVAVTWYGNRPENVFYLHIIKGHETTGLIFCKCNARISTNIHVTIINCSQNHNNRIDILRSSPSKTHKKSNKIKNTLN